MSTGLGYRDLISMAEANSSAKQREIEKKMRESGKGKAMDPKQAKLKVGVQKFLAKKEEEERRLKAENLKKKKMLLELRSQDRKANSRVNRMLKMTKSANKSVIADAKECLSEACTAQASETQPDEDDYGYTSTFAAEMHKKMLEKYKLVPKAPAPRKSDVEVPTAKRFENSKPSSSKPSSSSHVSSSKSTESLKPVTNEPPRQRIPKKAALPPPPAFIDLLKLAEQKSKEPVVIKKPTRDMMDGPEFEYGRPMTAKEKAEFMSQRAMQQRVKATFAGGAAAKEGPKQNTPSNSKTESSPENKVKKVEIPKPKKESKLETALTKGMPHQPSREPQPKSDIRHNVPPAVRPPEQKSSYSKSSPPNTPSSSGFKPSLRKMGPPPEKQPRLDLPTNKSSREYRPGPLQHKTSGLLSKSSTNSRSGYTEDSPRSRPPPEVESRPKSAPLRTSSSVPENRRRSPIPETGNRYEFPTRKKDKRPYQGRPVIHSDDEYDSEMDDFIDDSDVPQEDISNVIGQIFGYNKRKYADEDSDDECMESSVHQQWREEQRSLRIGIQEDLEDIRREQEEEKRKEMYLKRKQKLK